MNQKRSDRIEFLTPEGAERHGLVDLSKAGAAIIQSKAIPIDKIIKVAIQKLDLNAKVVYCQEKVGGYKIGLQFSHMSVEQSLLLADYVEKFSRGSTINIAIQQI